MMPNSPLKKRRAGVLLHPTSLPSIHGSGDLGPEAYRFVEFLLASGMGVWQILPLSPPHHDGSPYNCLSANAGNPMLISIELLIRQGWIEASQIEPNQVEPLADLDSHDFRRTMLIKAHKGFLRNATGAEKEGLARFITQQGSWLDDYALFQALRQEYHHAPWHHWPAAVRDRQPKVLNKLRLSLQDATAQHCFEQFVFFTQWLTLKEYANRHGILLFGDMPMFVAHDSVDVWARREYFELDADGNSLLVSGVPPDYFSPEGQHWGHPQYAWKTMQDDGFRYWVERMKVQFELLDMIRIDHFRGFESYWEIPASSHTASDGRWVKAPGSELFQALEANFGPLPMVAEDLGMLTPEVHALRHEFSFPGMAILQFAFDGSPGNPYISYKHEPNCVVYTGTHDNDTTIGWLNSLSPATRAYVQDYLGNSGGGNSSLSNSSLDYSGETLPWSLIRCTFASVGRWAIIPMQDILMLDGTHRMNTPGTITGNWEWGFTWDQLPLETPAQLRHLGQLYGR